MKALFICFLFITATYKAQTLDLCSPAVNWKFRQEGKKAWKNASVPGSVYLDLQKNKIIKDPLNDCREGEYKWISESNWEYQCEFTINESSLNKDHVVMNWQGLDTYAEVYINNKKVLQSDNMFICYSNDVKEVLHKGKNSMLIKFKSPLKAIKDAYNNNKLPGGERVYIRKAQYQFGWDWGPTYPSMGIYKGITLEAFNAKIENITISTKKLIASKAFMQISFDYIKSAKKPSEPANIKIVDTKNNTILLDTILNDLSQAKNIQFAIKNPKLWWCHNMGDAYLYNLEIKISTNTLGQQSFVKKVGVRTIQLSTNKDSIGSSFKFVLNGKEIYAKGANWIPSEYFLHDTSKYIQLLQASKNANMNMLRVWGGGVYETEDFYDWCDKNGMMVWQDFMFACAMYPGDSTFLNSVKTEATQQLQRIGQHPCIALWCGNNENSEGWYNWGWQKEFKYSKNDSLKIWNDYQQLFHQTLPDLISQYNPEIDYWPSSPSNGWGRDLAYKEGDVHYWGVWWGLQKFESYETKVGRFNSEYGFQSMPALTCLQNHSGWKITTLNDSFIKCHEKHARGFEIMDTALNNYFPKAKNLNDYIYLSQLAQAKAMKIAIDAHRSSKPYNMGTLVWQLNDCWPSISWSLIDYDCNKKAAWYAVKNSMQNKQIVFKKLNNKTEIHAINDSLGTWNDSLFVSLMDMDGKKLMQWKLAINVKENENLETFTIDQSQLKSFNKAQQFLCAQTKSGKEQFYFFANENELRLNPPVVQIKQLDSNVLKITANTFIKNAYIYNLKTNDTKLENNFMDLVPGKIYYIPFEPNQNIDPKLWKIKSLNEMTR